LLGESVARKLIKNAQPTLTPACDRPARLWRASRLERPGLCLDLCRNINGL